MSTGTDGRPRRAENSTPPGGDEVLVVQVGVDRLQLGGQPLGLLGQQQLPDGRLWVGLARHRCLQRTWRQENHNGVIQPSTGPRLPAFPQLNRYLSRTSSGASSYSHEGWGTAAWLADGLAGAGVKPCIAEEGMHTGNNIAHRLAAAIKTANFFLPLLTEKT